MHALMQVGIKRTSTECSMCQSPDPVTALNFDEPALPQGSTQQPAHPQQLLSLWDWYSQQQGWALSQPALPIVGSFTWPTELQANPSLQSDTCSLSGNLIPELSNLKDQHRCVLAFQLKQGSPSDPDNVQDSKRQPHGSAAVYLRLMLDRNTGNIHHQCLGLRVL